MAASSVGRKAKSSAQIWLVLSELHPALYSLWNLAMYSALCSATRWFPSACSIVCMSISYLIGLYVGVGTLIGGSVWLRHLDAFLARGMIVVEKRLVYRKYARLEVWDYP